jgi:hypothetical protein
MIERLKKGVLEVYGSELQYTKDCKILAHEVFEKTGEMLSTTTIRRLFGFLKSSSSPSKFTLNVLSRYIGHNSWDEFTQLEDSVEVKVTEVHERWDSLHKRSLQLSEYTYNLIREQSGIPFEAVIEREFAEKRIDSFLESDQMAMSFVAPGGFGKSSMLGKWFQRNWVEATREDIPLFLNADFLINFLNNDFKLDRWIQDQLGYANENILNYFLENPEKCKGKIIIILDALDEITYDIIKLERLFLQISAFIANHKNSDKIKLIITSRNSTWEKFACPLINDKNFQKDIWFGLNMEYVSNDKTNMHPLNEEEIQKSSGCNH